MAVVDIIDCIHNHNYHLNVQSNLSQTLGLKKVAVVQNWPLFRVWSLKITINIEMLVVMLAVVDSWSLFRGGH